MFNRATRDHTPPKYLSADRDPLYRFYQWQANLRILDVKEIKTVPYVPLSHPFVERLIGRQNTVRTSSGPLSGDWDQSAGAFSTRTRIGIRMRNV